MTDEWKKLSKPIDTSLRLMGESHRLGNRDAWTHPRAFQATSGAVELEAWPIIDSDGGCIVHRGAKRPMHLSAFDCIVYRVDPPVDARYRARLEVLKYVNSMQSGDTVPIVNDSSVLLNLSSKLECAKFGQLTPDTILSEDLRELNLFGRAFGRVVVKPLASGGGAGVKVLDWTTEARAAASYRTLRSRRVLGPFLLQRFLPEIAKGEIRMWFVDGVLLGAMRFVPRDGLRVRGATDPSFSVRMTPQAIALSRIVGQYLCDTGINLAAVDSIGGLITDINFVSPGLLPRLERQLNKNLARTIMTRLAHTIQRR